MTGIEIKHWPKSIAFYINIGNSESYSEPRQTLKTEPFVKMLTPKGMNHFHKNLHVTCLIAV